MQNGQVRIYSQGTGCRSVDGESLTGHFTGKRAAGCRQKCRNLHVRDGGGFGTWSGGDLLSDMAGPFIGKAGFYVEVHQVAWRMFRRLTEVWPSREF